MPVGARPGSVPIGAPTSRAATGASLGGPPPLGFLPGVDGGLHVGAVLVGADGRGTAVEQAHQFELVEAPVLAKTLAS